MKIIDCICGGNVVHSPACKRHNQKMRWKTYLPKRREERKALKELHMCYYCRGKVQPIVYYPAYCTKCATKNKQNQEKWKDGLD